MNQKFTKQERLKSKILIGELFAKGEKSYSHPFRVTVLKCPSPLPAPVQLLISVPRAIHRNATDRNRIKRLIREAYRKNKPILYETLERNNIHLLVCIQYVSKEILTYQMIQEKIIVILLRLKEKHAEAAG
jgi:ribonuclease P protein component